MSEVWSLEFLPRIVLFMTLSISVEDPLSKETLFLLQTHLDFCMASTPPEHVYALDASKLKAPDITVFGARLSEVLVGVGAIRIMNQDHAELKSMHTLASFRGKGIGKSLVLYIEKYAKEHGISRLSLETGTNDAFRSARDLYASLGYTSSEAFGEYVISDDNICMTKLI